MNREISFKGLKIDTKEMVYGHLTIDPISNEYYIEPFDESKPVRVINQTVGQYTGKCDCDGLKIYEGDLIESPHNEICIVFFSDHSASFEANSSGKDLPVTSRQFTWLGGEFESCKWIGNIHENPELLINSKETTLGWLGEGCKTQLKFSL